MHFTLFVCCNIICFMFLIFYIHGNTVFYIHVNFAFYAVIFICKFRIIHIYHLSCVFIKISQLRNQLNIYHLNLCSLCAVNLLCYVYSLNVIEKYVIFCRCSFLPYRKKIQEYITYLDFKYLSFHVIRHNVEFYTHIQI